MQLTRCHGADVSTLQFVLSASRALDPTALDCSASSASTAVLTAIGASEPSIGAILFAFVHQRLNRTFQPTAPVSNG